MFIFDLMLCEEFRNCWSYPYLITHNRHLFYFTRIFQVKTLIYSLIDNLTPHRALGRLRDRCAVGNQNHSVHDASPNHKRQL